MLTIEGYFFPNGLMIFFVLSVDKLDSSFSRSRSSSMSSLENISAEAIQCLAFADSYTKKAGRYLRTQSICIPVLLCKFLLNIYFIFRPMCVPYPLGWDELGVGVDLNDYCTTWRFPGLSACSYKPLW